MARVDAEAWLHRALQDNGLEATVWAYDGQEGWPHRVHRTSLQVDVRADSKQEAWEAADAAMRLLFDNPPAAPAGGVISGIDLVTGPLWLPDDDGRPRYVVRVTVAAHPSNA